MTKSNKIKQSKPNKTTTNNIVKDLRITLNPVYNIIYNNDKISKEIKLSPEVFKVPIQENSNVASTIVV
jgi:hypothetical protein